jgi:hypothetical protein
MKMTLLLAAAGLAMTVCESHGGDPDSPAPTRSDTDPATKLAVTFTGNRWTTDKLLIATGTLTNTNPMPVTVTRIIATGFDKQQNVVAGGPGALEEPDYTIGDAEIGPGATTVFKVAFRDPKKTIRFVKATTLLEPIPTPTPIPIATPIPAVEAPAMAARPTSTAVQIPQPPDSDSPSAAVPIPNADIVDNALAYSKLLIPFLKTHTIPGRIQEERVLSLFRLLYHAAESEGYADRQDWFIELVMRQLKSARVVDDCGNQ